MLTRPNAYLVLVTIAVVAFVKAGSRPATRCRDGRSSPCRGSSATRSRSALLELVTSDGFTLAAVFAEPAQKQNTFVDPVLDSAYENDLDLKLAQFDESVWSDKLLHSPGTVCEAILGTSSRMGGETPSPCWNSPTTMALNDWTAGTSTSVTPRCHCLCRDWPASPASGPPP